jgi:cupin fold WbuC family metalloprotein
MKIIDQSLMDELSEEARRSPRLRKNMNFHESYEEPSQRLLNAMEPGSYIRPHRHLADPKPEAFIGVRGRAALIVFTDEGKIESVISFGAGCEVAGVELPPGVWHTVVCMESGSVFYETKPGPFNPIQKQDMAPWAPEEGSAEVPRYLAGLVSAVLEGNNKT